MPVFTIHRREVALLLQSPKEHTEEVAVTYSTPAVPPRVVRLPRDQYRDADPGELAGQPLFRVLPKDAQAAELERKALAADMEGAIRSRGETFTL